MSDKHEFHGIGIGENDELFCPDGSEDIKKFWHGINEISKWIEDNADSDLDGSKEALLYVERFNSWCRTMKIEAGVTKVGEKSLNDIFGPAVDFAIKNSMP